MHACAHTQYTYGQKWGALPLIDRRPLLVLPSPSPSPSPSHYTLNYNYTRVQGEERGKSFAPPPHFLVAVSTPDYSLTHTSLCTYSPSLCTYLHILTSLCTHSPPSVPTHLPLYPLTSLFQSHAEISMPGPRACRLCMRMWCLVLSEQTVPSFLRPFGSSICALHGCTKYTLNP